MYAGIQQLTVYFQHHFDPWPSTFAFSGYSSEDSNFGPLLDFMGSFTNATDASVTLPRVFKYSEPWLKSLFLTRQTLRNDFKSPKRFRAGIAGSEQELREYTKFSDGE